MEISLRAAKDEKTICRLRRDHYCVGDWAIMTDGYRVWISQQAMGKNRTDHIEIPKPIFDRLLRSYERPQKTVRR